MSKSTEQNNLIIDSDLPKGISLLKDMSECINNISTIVSSLKKKFSNENDTQVSLYKNFSGFLEHLLMLEFIS